MAGLLAPHRDGRRGTVRHHIVIASEMPAGCCGGRLETIQRLLHLIQNAELPGHLPHVAALDLGSIRGAVLTLWQIERSAAAGRIDVPTMLTLDPTATGKAALQRLPKLLQPNPPRRCH